MLGRVGELGTVLGRRWEAGLRIGGLPGAAAAVRLRGEEPGPSFTGLGGGLWGGERASVGKLGQL